MEKYFDILTKCPLFEGIDTKILGAILDCLGVEVRSVRKNEVILAEGEPARDVGIVLSGEVLMLRDDINGNRSIIMHIEPSELFAETFACAGVEVMPCSMVAAANGEVMFINCKRILTVCNNACEFHSRLIQNLLRIVASKNMSFDKKINVTSQRSTKDKIMTYLLHEAEKAGSDEFTISYDRQALADYLGVERSAMSAELSKLKSEGLIDYNKNRFKILV